MSSSDDPEPDPSGAEPRAFVVRELDQGEKKRMQECLRWLHAEGARAASESDDRIVAEAYARAIDEARRRWPDVAKLIGFD